MKNDLLRVSHEFDPGLSLSAYRSKDGVHITVMAMPMGISLSDRPDVPDGIRKMMKLKDVDVTCIGVIGFNISHFYCDHHKVWHTNFEVSGNSGYLCL